MFRPIRDPRGKKQRKPNLIRPEDKIAIKDKFLDSGARSKEGKRHPQTRTPTLRERERERSETQNHASLKLTFLFSALKKATKW